MNEEKLIELVKEYLIVEKIFKYCGLLKFKFIYVDVLFRMVNL